MSRSSFYGREALRGAFALAVATAICFGPTGRGHCQDGALVSELQSHIGALENTYNAGYCSLPSTLSTNGSPGLIVSADFLYWTVRNAGFEYGITDDPAAPNDGGPVGTVLAIGGDYTPAYRVGLGFRACNGADVVFKYTKFNNNREELSGPVRATIITSDNGVNTDADQDTDTDIIIGIPNPDPQDENVTPEDRADTALAIFRFDYKTLDLEIGQNLIMSDALTLRVSGGGRGLFVDQLEQVTYTGNDFEVPLTAFQTSKFDGGGIVVGSDMRWNVLGGLTFNVGANTGLMLGSMRTRTFIPDSPDTLETDSGQSTDIDGVVDEPAHVLTTPTDVTYRETRMVPLIEVVAGVNYAFAFGHSLVDFGAGYQMTNYFNLQDTRTFSDAFQEGQNSHVMNSITLDGLFARLGFNY